MQRLMKTWAFVGLVVVLKAEGPDWSTNELNFLSLVNGKFTNSAQVAQETSKKHDLIEAMSRPVDVPVLRPNPVIFAEQASNGMINVLQLGVISEGADKVINLQVYNFTKTMDHKPGTFNFDVLQNLTLEDLQTDPDCVASFVPVGDKAYFGDWAVCRNTIHGIHPSYPLLFSCDGVDAAVPADVREAYNIVPYVFTVLERYPLIGAPKDYVSPCEKKSTQPCTNSDE